MCKNARNRCSIFVAMAKNGQEKEAAEAFVKMVNGKEKREKNYVRPIN